MSTDPTIEAARVEGFNTLHSIGTPVRYWKGAREGDGKVSRTRAAAQLLSGHTAVVWLENVAGCIALTHVQPITEGEFTATPAEQWPAAATGRSFRTYLDREERDQLDALPHIGETDRPRIVVLCGSTRFRTEIADANRRFTLDGYIVLAPGVFGHDGDQVTDEQKEALDDLHFRKIDLADEVYVVNPYGYIGESTRLEMSYARRTGKPVRRLVESRADLPTYGGNAPGTLRSRP